MVRRNLETTPPPPPSPFPPEQSNLLEPSVYSAGKSPPSSTDVSSSIMVTVLVLAVAVIVSASLYLLLRFLRRHRHRHRDNFRQSSSLHHHHHHHRHNSRRVSPAEKNPLIDSLPLFTFDSLTGGDKSAGDGDGDCDCAVCLSKFESKDLLRLLPICCHAFHAECIDTWLAGNLTCPLCRSPIFLSDKELLGKFSHSNSLSSSVSSSGSRSFRVEIGNVSRRGISESGEIPRSYSIGGTFDYVLNDGVSEVPIGSFQHRPSDFKVESTEEPPLQAEEQEVLAAEVGTRGGWLKEYLSYSLSSSRTASFRSSGRWFFTGSSRRSTAELTRESELDLEGSQLSEEIGELFRWLSGV